MQIIGFIVVDRVHFSHYQIALLHDPPHVELVLFVLFALLRNVSRVERKVGKGGGLDIDFPSFVGNFVNFAYNNVPDLRNVLVS